jgi:hypothetical protein
MQVSAGDCEGSGGARRRHLLEERSHLLRQVERLHRHQMAVLASTWLHERSVTRSWHVRKDALSCKLHNTITLLI